MREHKMQNRMQLKYCRASNKRWEILEKDQDDVGEVKKWDATNMYHLIEMSFQSTN